MASLIYILCALVSLACTVLLLRGYVQSRTRLLLWSGLCFLGFTISNLLVFIDLKIFPQIDLYPWRLISAAIAMLILVYGLIWEGDR
jgi:heme/copper-type cytochrome/quinol oxidase subunit 4